MNQISLVSARRYRLFRMRATLFSARGALGVTQNYRGWLANWQYQAR